MCQIVGWREHRDSFSNFLRKMSKIAGHEPCAGRVRQCKERHVFRVGPSMGPANGIGKIHALFDQELQPKRRKPKPVKLGTSCDGPVFFDDQRAGDQLHLPVQDPIHDELRRGAPGPYTGGHNYVCVQDGEPHLVFRRLRSLRSCLISCSISSSFISPEPDALAWTQLSRRLAFAIALRNSRSSMTTSPSTGTRK